jgi:4-hydroxybenzoate polyprenyltransferase
MKPFLKLIRWPNLVFIVLTQALFNYAVVIPLFHQAGLLPNLGNIVFGLLCFASVLIAAAGYIINDYFDFNIDLINKPDKMVIGKSISRRQAIIWHFILSAIGVALSFIASYKLADRFFAIGITNLVCVLVLWVYSTTYKRRILIGNILISLLTAWSVLVIYLAETPQWWQTHHFGHTPQALALTKLFRVAAMYGGFAFIISLIREVIKDMEDVEGDRREGCRTMPIVWGIPAAKIFAAVWTTVLIGALFITQFYVVQFGWWLFAAYIFIAVAVPLIFMLRKLYAAQATIDYSKLSKQIKYLMLTGILSMVFFWWYF